MAAVSIGGMFLGAFILPASRFGFLLIGGGGLAMAALFLTVLFDRQ